MKYYVSNLGDDANSGIRPDQPWKTLAKVNAARFQPGDVVMFRRGDTFYGQIRPFGYRSQNARPVVYTCYGVGPLPIISRYKVIPAASWVEHSTNIWKVDLADLSKFTGDQEITAQGINVGFLKYGSSIKPSKKFSVGTLTADWDFYSDNLQWLYIKLPTIPGTINAAVGNRVLDCATNGSTGLRFNGLHVKGCGGHALSGALSDTMATGCVFGELGGGELIGFATPNTRYGNGIEMWNGSRRSSAIGNLIYDVYDVGCTMQGNLVTLASGWEDCWFRKNVFMRCNQTFEIWATGTASEQTPAGSGFHRTGFVDNICMDAGYAWSSDIRPDQGTKAHLLLYTINCPDVDVLVSGNKFYRAKGSLISRGGVATTLPVGYVLKDNHVFLEDTAKLFAGLSYGVTDWPALAAQIGTGEDTIVTRVADAGSAMGVTQTMTKLIESAASGASSNSFFEKSLTDLHGMAYQALDDVNSLRSDSIFPGFESLSSGVVGDYWAKILILDSLDSGARLDGVFAYHIGGDSVTNRQGVGMVSFQLDPKSPSPSYFNMDVMELLPFRTGHAATDFKAVVIEDALVTGGKVRIEVYFNIGKDNYQKLKVTPISVMQSGSLKNFWSFRSTEVLVTSLPAGTQYTATANSAGWQKKALTGTVAPTTTPEYVGQTYLDTTAKKEYRAFGVASSADWVVLN